MPESERCSDDGTVLKKRTKILVATHFVGIIRAESSKVECDNSPTQDGFLSSVSVDAAWKHTGIDGSDGRIIGWYGTEETVSQRTVSSHIKVEKAPEASVPTSPPTVLTSTFYDAGTPAYDANGNVLRDADNRFVFDIPPAATVELRSTVAAAGSTCTYTYEVENLTDEARDFSLPQVTTTTWQSGWQGTVSAHSTCTLSYQISGETNYIQNCQATLSENDAGGTFSTPALVFVPESQLAYDGTVDISTIVYQPGIGNVVTFRITGDAATEAVLLRNTGTRLSVVAENEQTYQPNVYYTIVDPDPPSGANPYRVAVGLEPNGVYSDEELITN